MRVLKYAHFCRRTFVRFVLCVRRNRTQQTRAFRSTPTHAHIISNSHHYARGCRRRRRQRRQRRRRRRRRA